MEEPIRILIIGMHDKIGGVETFLMNYYRNIDRNKVQFDFISIYDKLYSESNSRFIITVKEDALTTIEEALSKNNVAYSVIGSVCSDGFKISNDNDVLVDCSVEKITKENTTTIEKQMA